MPDLVDPGRIIALAHGAKPANWGRSMAADYPAQVTEFLTLLARRQIPFVIVGGIALLQHVRGRNTEDLDLILSAPRLGDLPELKLNERNERFATGYFQELRIDILFAEIPLFDLIAREYTQSLAYQNGLLPTATVDGLVLLKLFALPSLYRQFDYDRISIYEADLTQLLARSSSDDNFFLRHLAPHLPPSDQVELTAILLEIRGRLRRMKRSGSSANG